MGIEAAAGAGLAMQAAGAVTSASGAYNQAKTQQATLGYESAVANNNATIADYQASQALQIGQQQEQMARLHTAQMFGAQRASMAANGIDLGEGTATDVLTTTDVMGQHDALTIRDNAARQAWGYQVQGQNYRSNAAADSAMGSAISPGAAVATSLLGSAPGVAKSWYNYNQAKNGKGG